MVQQAWNGPSIHPFQHPTSNRRRHGCNAKCPGHEATREILLSRQLKIGQLFLEDCKDLVLPDIMHK